jgi:hypothetical protein
MFMIAFKRTFLFFIPLFLINAMVVSAEWTKPVKNIKKNYIGLELSYFNLHSEWRTPQLTGERVHEIGRLPISLGGFLKVNAWRGFGIDLSADWKLINLWDVYNFITRSGDSHEMASLNATRIDIYTQELFSINMVFKMGLGEDMIYNMGLGVKLDFWGDADSYHSDNIFRGSPERPVFKEKDLSLFLSVNIPNFSSPEYMAKSIILPQTFNIGVILTPGFGSLSESGWGGFFLELKTGIGFGI